jgi:hypothetical protein
MSRTATPKPPPYSDFLGVKITHVSPERVEAELTVRDVHDNSDGILHGGAIMSLADTLGGTATMANIGNGAHHDDRKQDQLFRRHSDRRHRAGRMHPAASRPHHHGVADQDHAQRRPPVRAGDTDAVGADAEGVSVFVIASEAKQSRLCAADPGLLCRFRSSQ